MYDVVHLVKFTCYECGSKFLEKQGSRRKYCDPCMLTRIKSGKKQEKKGVK